VEADRPRVFVSATTADLGTHRRAVCEELHQAGFDFDVQDYSDPDPSPLPVSLEKRIGECIAVVCLVGSHYGSEPKEQSGPRRSYTQLEYDLAIKIDKPVFVYYPDSSKCMIDGASKEDAEKTKLQTEHFNKLKTKHTAQPFDSIDNLRVRIVRLAHNVLPDLEWLWDYPKRLLESSLLKDGPAGRPVDEAPDLHLVWEVRSPSERRSVPGPFSKVMAPYSRAALVGSSGCGKTVVMKKLLMEAANKLKSKLRGLVERIDGGAEQDAHIPLWLQALHFECENPSVDAMERFAAGGLKGFLGRYGRPWDRIARILEDGRCLILLDGLDEMPSKEWEQRLQAVRAFLERYCSMDRGNRIVVSARPGTLPRGAGERWGFTEVHVPRLDAEGRERLLKWLSRKGQALGRSLPPWIAEPGTAAEVMGESPFFVSVIAELLEEGESLPDDPGLAILDLLRKRIEREFRSHGKGLGWRTLTEKTWSAKDVGDLVLHVLGRVSLSSLESGGEMRIDWSSLRARAHELAKDLRLPIGLPLLPDPRPGPRDSLLEAAAALGLIQADYENEQLFFTHALWRDVLASGEMARRFVRGEKPEQLPHRTERSRRADFVRTAQDQFAPLPPAARAELHWIGACRFLSGLLQGEHRANFYRWLLGRNPALSASLLADRGSPPEDEATRAELVRVYLDEVVSGDRSLLERVVFGRALGMLGDPRLWEEPARPIVPKLALVPGGTYRIGLSEDDRKRLLRVSGRKSSTIAPSEHPAREKVLSAFLLGKYAVTNAHFTRFVETGGYGTRAFWMGDEAGDAAWEWLQKNGGENRRPDFWTNPAYNESNQPVVGIARFEAEAYCRWLTQAARDGRTYRLPTVAEWQAGARGKEGRLYPWGDEPDPSRCNCWHAGYLGMTSPVGVYPEGATPDGIEDMAGNVHELCLDAETGKIYACGGSWMSDEISDCRATKMRPVPDGGERSGEVGFRIVAAAKDPSEIRTTREG